MPLLGAALSLRLAAGRSQDLADLLPTQDDALVLGQHLGEVRVVEVLVDVLMEGDDDRSICVGQSVAYSPAPVAVTQGLQAAILPSSADSFGLSIADAHDLGCFFQRQGSLSYLLENVTPMDFLSTQDDMSLHALHLHEEDIFSLQLKGTKSHC